MAQTRKKRRSKHRGTAAGTIEARGRTGRRLTEQERGSIREDAKARRTDRLRKPPTLRSATTRAVFAAAFLFLLTQLGVGGMKKLDVTTSLLLCVLAMAIYIPLGYATDTFVYKRFQKREAGKRDQAKREKKGG